MQSFAKKIFCVVVLINIALGALWPVAFSYAQGADQAPSGGTGITASDILQIPCQIINGLTNAANNIIGSVVGSIKDAVGGAISSAVGGGFFGGLLGDIFGGLFGGGGGGAVPVYDVFWDPTVQNIKYCLPILKQLVLRSLQDTVIKWAVDDKGIPRFLTNWMEYTGIEALQYTLNGLFNDVSLSQIDPAFADIAKAAIFAQLPHPLGQNFPYIISSTLQQNGINAIDFYKDFSNGGWAAFGLSWAPQNNVFGSIALLQTELENRFIQESAARINEGISGAGFISTKICGSNDYFSTPDGSRQCLHPYITNPGKVIAENVAHAAGISDFDTIVNSDQVWDLIAYIIGSMIDKVVKSGDAGLIGVATPGAGLDNLRNVSSSTPTPTNTNQSSLSAAQTILANLQTQLSALQQLQAELSQYQTTLQNLKSCQQTKKQSTSATDQALSSVNQQLTTVSAQLSGILNPSPLKTQIAQVQQIITGMNAVSSNTQSTLLMNQLTDQLIALFPAQQSSLGGIISVSTPTSQASQLQTIATQTASQATQIQNSANDISAKIQQANSDLAACQAL